MSYTPMVATKLSFVNGSLVPKGAVVPVPDKIFVPRAEREGAEDDASDKLPRNTNLKPASAARKQPVAVMAAIGPTGPNPTMPQQVPPGTISQGSGFFNDGVKLVAEGSEAAAVAIESGATSVPADVIEEEAAESAFDHDGDGEEGGSLPEDGTVADVKAELADADADEITVIETRESQREGGARKGVTDAIAAARAKLADGE